MSLHKLSPLAILLVGAVILSSPDLHAGASNKSGNPYGNSSYFANGGTYSAICRGPNSFLAGVTFSTSTTNIGGTNSSTNANSGVSTVYAGGQQYLGTAAGFADPGSSEVGATYIAYFAFEQIVPSISNSVTTNIVTNNTTLGVPSQTVVTNYSVIYSTNTVFYYGSNYPTPISNVPVVTAFTNITGYTTITTTNYIATNSIVPTFETNPVTTYATNNYTNWVSGQFSAQIQNNYPNQSFAGSGVAYGVNLYTGGTNTYTNTVTGTLVQQGTIQ